MIAKKKASKGKNSTRPWSGSVNATSNAMDLKPHVFLQTDAAKIARSVKRSAEQSHRRKAPPFQSAMSMLNFYVDRARRNLKAAQKKRLQQAKQELRLLFHRPQSA